MARPAISHGESLSLADDVEGGLVRRLAARVAATPHGLIRSLADGSHRQVSYEAAWERSARIAAALPDRRGGDCPPIVLLARDAVDFAPAFWACLRGGHLCVALSSAVEAAKHPQDALVLRHLLRKLGNPILLLDEHFERSGAIGDLIREHRVLTLSSVATAAAEWDEAAERPSPVCLIATSGSTGSFKLAAIDERALLHRYFARGDPVPRAGTNALGIFAIDSITGLRLAFLQYETYTHVPQAIVAARPGAILTAIETLRISYLAMTNATASHLLEAAASLKRPLDFGALTGCGMGGEAVGRDLAAQVGALFARFGSSAVIRAGYGTTETSLLVLGAEPAQSRDESVRLGPCARGVAMRIVGETGDVLEEGAVGAVEVFAPLKVFSGYWGEPELSRATFTADGWWRTGDLGQLDGGVFTFRGRSKQILVVNGRKLSLVEIECHLQAHTDVGAQVFACAVRSAADATERLGIAFVARRGAEPGAIAETIRSQTLRRFGIRPDPVVAIPRSRLPLTASGKVQRMELAGLLVAERRRAIAREGASTRIEATLAPGTIEAILDETWREVLDLDTGFDRARTFFEYGGDSLRSAALHACIEAKLDRQLDLPAFFAAPSFETLLRLVLHAGPAAAESDDPVMWPLPTAFRQRQLAFLETWPGRRCTRDRLVTGLNLDGGLPPLFCVFQAAEEFAGLAEALGERRPVYAFRSAFRIAETTEDIVQSIALRYVQDLERVRPEGPVFLLGQCQGAGIAIAMAQHLLRRGRHVPLLVLVEWPTEPAQYLGATLLVYGRDSLANPKSRHHDPRAAWRRMFPDHDVAEVPGSYARLYEGENLRALAQALDARLAAALAAPPRFLPTGGCRVDLTTVAMPERLEAGRTARLVVAVRNVGDIAVSARTTGLMLGNYWTREGGTIGDRLDARVALPDLAPGGSLESVLTVRAPAEPGRYRLCLDLIEEGLGWLNPAGRSAFEADVDVSAPEPSAPRPRPSLFHRFRLAKRSGRRRSVASSSPVS